MVLHLVSPDGGGLAAALLPIPYDKAASRVSWGTSCEDYLAQLETFAFHDRDLRTHLAGLTRPKSWGTLIQKALSALCLGHVHVTGPSEEGQDLPEDRVMSALLTILRACPDEDLESMGIAFPDKICPCVVRTLITKALETGDGAWGEQHSSVMARVVGLGLNAAMARVKGKGRVPLATFRERLDVAAVLLGSGDLFSPGPARDLLQTLDLSSWFTPAALPSLLATLNRAVTLGPSADEEEWCETATSLLACAGPALQELGPCTLRWGPMELLATAAETLASLMADSMAHQGVDVT